jgi:hypothetical protein
MNGEMMGLDAYLNNILGILLLSILLVVENQTIERPQFTDYLYHIKWYLE